MDGLERCPRALFAMGSGTGSRQCQSWLLLCGAGQPCRLKKAQSPCQEANLLPSGGPPFPKSLGPLFRRDGKRDCKYQQVRSGLGALKEDSWRGAGSSSDVETTEEESHQASIYTILLSSLPSRLLSRLCQGLRAGGRHGGSRRLRLARGGRPGPSGPAARASG